jgi:ParB family chromosome partitioning protein
MKKGDMAKEAERLLADTGWLPEPLRLAAADGDTIAEPADQNGADEALPAFLTGEDEEESPADIDEDDESMIAAE